MPRNPRPPHTRATAALLPVLFVLTTLAGLFGLVGPSLPAAGALTLPPAGNIGPIAGSGSGGDGGQATSASLNAPGGVAVNGSDTYIVESNANRVRKVDGSGVITTVAGVGTSGYSGDGGPATAATLNGPQGIATDGTSLYIADTGNGVIRKVDLGSGTISTFAGGGGASANGPATSLRLASPWGVAMHGGSLYVVEFGGRKVWQITTGGAASLFAGTGTFTSSGTGGDGGLATAATFKAPAAIAFDNAGTAYIADPIDGRVRKVVGGMISNFAGTPGGTSFAGDGGPAGSATLFQPYGVAVRTTTVSGQDPGPTPSDPPVPWSVTYQTVVIVDTQNARLRFVPIAASPAASHSTINPDIPSGGAAGDIYTALGNGTKSSSGDGGVASSATTKDPRSIAASGGSLLVGETQGNRVRKLTAASQAAASPQPADATSMDTPLRSVIVTTAAGNGSATLAGDGGPATNAGLANPQGLSSTPAGDVLIADTNNQAIRLVNASTGIITTVAGSGMKSNPPAVPLGDGGPATSATLNSPAAAVMNAAGDIFIADTFNNLIRKVDHATGNISTIAGAVGQRGFSGDGGPATSALLNQPYGIALEAAGNVVVSDTVNHRIRIIGTDGKINTIAGCGCNGPLGDGGAATAANLSYPTALTIDAMGTYLFADAGHSLVRRVVPNGVITTVAGGGNSLAEGAAATSADLSFVSSVAVDPYGELFVTDLIHNRVRRVETNGTINTIAGVPGGNPGAGGYAGDGGAASGALLKSPFSVAMGPTGSLLVADTGNSRVRAVGGAVTSGAVASANYVTAAYHDFVNAPPTPAQLEAGVLRSNMASPYQFVIDLANSPQWITNLVTQFYENTLGRQPDAGGLNFWINAIQTGQYTVAQAASQFYASLEYYNKVGGTDSLWVDDLYNKLLHRTPDQGGHDYWVGQIGQHDRGYVAFQMFQSPESANDRVTDTYEVRCGPGEFVATCPSYRPLLNRAPDPAGLTFWAGQVIQKGDIVLAAALGSSPEYINDAQSRTFP